MFSLLGATPGLHLGARAQNALGWKVPLILVDSKLLPLSPSSCAGQANNVFLNMEEDFMKPAISVVDELLEAGVNVTVYNGQLDLIVDTMGKNPLRVARGGGVPG